MLQLESAIFKTRSEAFLRCEQVRAKKNFWCDLAADEEAIAGGSD
jgi:hypothetical protein